MSCVSGTNSVNDGLVFHFDLANSVKSWKGKPTSNIRGGTNMSSNYAGNVAVANNSYNLTAPDGSTGWSSFTATQVNSNARLGQFPYTSQPANTTYTYSIELYNPGPGTIQVHIDGNFGTGHQNIPLGYSRYIFTHATSVYRNESIWFGSENGTTGVTYSPSRIIYFKNYQVEEGPIASKWTNGVRLDTASIVDVSPTKSTITAANLTYRQDDTPTFDGTNDYVEIDSSVVPSGSSVTLDIWVKDITVKQTNAFYAGNSASGRTLSVHLPWSDQVVYFDSGGAAGSTAYDRVTYTSTSTDRAGWHNWTFTKNLSAGVMRIYLDGIQKASSTGKNISPDISTVARIGSALSANYFNGEISQVKIYNKALTAQEVKQNFEATRTKYGI